MKHYTYLGYMVLFMMEFVVRDRLRRPLLFHQEGTVPQDRLGRPSFSYDCKFMVGSAICKKGVQDHNRIAFLRTANKMHQLALDRPCRQF